MSGSRYISLLIGVSFLITGSCIGGAMLGLPVITAESGFIPSLIYFSIAWLFMFTTGCLLLEVNLWFKGEEVSFISMAKRTLGPFGALSAWILYLFLFYCLMVAFISGSGPMIEMIAPSFLSERMNCWGFSTLFTLFFGGFIFLGTYSVDMINRFFMMGLIVSYLVLIGMSLWKTDIEIINLSYSNWGRAPFAFPAMIISFGFHNLIPSLTTYTKGDQKLLIKSFFVGSLFSLVIYFIWQAIILGIIPLEGEFGLRMAYSHGHSATVALEKLLPGSYISLSVAYFAICALVTTFVGIGLGFVDFLADGFSIKKGVKERLCLVFLVLFPPYAIGYIYPGIFLKALGAAGGLGAVTLFGILPALMVYRGRYHLGMKGDFRVIGGKKLLIGIFLMAIIVMGIQISNF